MPPVFKGALLGSDPPQTIIPAPLQTAVCADLAAGALVVDIWVQELFDGLYLNPSPFTAGDEPYPPNMIISVPVQTAEKEYLPVGALVVEVAVQESVAGLYLPPVLMVE